MSQGKVRWLLIAAEALVWVGLWGLALYVATTPGEKEVLWIASMTIWLPYLPRELVDILSRIRLAPSHESPN